MSSEAGLASTTRGSPDDPAWLQMVRRDHLKAQHRPRLGVRGQSTVEFAVLMPIVVVVLLAVVQAGLLVRDRLGVLNATRVGARAAALSPDVHSTESALQLHGIDIEGVSVTLTGDRSPGGIATVEVARPASQVPVVGVVVRSMILRERIAFRVEDPDASGP